MNHKQSSPSHSGLNLLFTLLGEGEAGEDRAKRKRRGDDMDGTFVYATPRNPRGGNGGPSGAPAYLTIPAYMTPAAQAAMPVRTLVLT